MQKDPHPIEMILQEIERALAARLFYMAIVLALTLPDICAALESEDGRTSPQKFSDWYDAHLKRAYRFMTGEDCYSLRCGVVHQGRFGHGSKQFGRVVLTFPGPSGAFIHNNLLMDALNLDADRFCRDVIEAVRSWYDAKRNDPNVKANLPRLVTLHPNGLAPYIVGHPVIA